MAVNKLAKIRKDDKINGVFWREHLSELEKNLITFSFTASKEDFSFPKGYYVGFMATNFSPRFIHLKVVYLVEKVRAIITTVEGNSFYIKWQDSSKDFNRQSIVNWIRKVQDIYQFLIKLD